MRAWLITGGAGFIGANLVRHVLDARPDVHVVVLDALTYAGHRASLRAAEEAHPGRTTFVHGDVCDGALLASLFAEHRFERVLHLAAESHVDRSLYGPGVFVRTNVDGTFRVLEAARAHAKESTRPARVLVVSTDEVYGSLGPQGLFREDTPLDPSSPYSASKASADLLALSYHRTYGLDVVLTRCSNNYGPYQLPEKLIPLMILRANANEPLPVYGDGLNVRDWIHVEDHCAGILLAADKGEPGRVYNLGGESERTNLHVVRAVLARVGRPESLIKYVQDRPGHDRRYAMDISRARAELGFEPRHDFERALDATVDWYLANDAWVSAVRTAQHDEHLRRTYAGRAEAPAAVTTTPNETPRQGARP